MVRNLARVLIVLFVLLAGMAVPFRSASALAPTIVTAATATPNMVSLFGDNLAQTRSSPFGPSWTAVVVKGGGTITGAKAKLGDFVNSIMPTDARDRALSTATWDAMIAALNNTALTDMGGGIWRINVVMESLLAEALPKFSSVVARRIVAQDLRTGQKTIAVELTNAGDVPPTTITSNATVWVVDAQIMLHRGWNLRSTPMALADTTWSSILDLGNKTAVVTAGVKFNSQAGSWQVLGASDSVASLDGVYIYASQDDAIGSRLFRSSAAVVQPASKNLYRGAWNLIGTAPDFTANFALVTTNNMRGLLRVDTALVGLGTEWVTAISAGETNDPLTQTYSYTGIGALGTYTWKFGAPAWSVNRGDALPVLTTTSTGATVPFAGYWVFMQTSPSGLITPVVLNGMNSGVLTDAWLVQLFTLGP